MKTINVDNSLLERFRILEYRFKGIIPIGVYHYYPEILAGNSIESYMELFSLPKETLLFYARVCQIIVVYHQIIELAKLAEQELQILEEYQDYADELQDEGEDLLDNFGELEESKSEGELDFSNIEGLIIYPSYIEESKQKIDNSHSGKGEETRKRIAGIIENLVCKEYMHFRKSGAIHQMHNNSSAEEYYIDGNAVERIGNNSTKVIYIRIPLSISNRESIKSAFSIDFRTFYLVLNYRDFKNEGIEEKRLYAEIKASLNRNMEEIMHIINIFKNDFTPETYPSAMHLIREGLKRTEEIISITKNNRRYGLRA